MHWGNVAQPSVDAWPTFARRFVEPSEHAAQRCMRGSLSSVRTSAKVSASAAKPRASVSAPCARSSAKESKSAVNPSAIVWEQVAISSASAWEWCARQFGIVWLPSAMLSVGVLPPFGTTASDRSVGRSAHVSKQWDQRSTSAPLKCSDSYGKSWLP